MLGGRPPGSPQANTPGMLENRQATKTKYVPKPKKPRKSPKTPTETQKRQCESLARDKDAPKLGTKYLWNRKKDKKWQEKQHRQTSSRQKATRRTNRNFCMTVGPQLWLIRLRLWLIKSKWVLFDESRPENTHKLRFLKTMLSKFSSFFCYEIGERGQWNLPVSFIT